MESQMKKFVSYRRVSTTEQGKSGLGLDAQAQAIARFVEDHSGALLKDFTEVETGKGSNALQRRPVLNQAIDFAKRNHATLLVAKLDRLSRNVHFITGVMERGVNFRAVDHPTADKTMLHFYAVMAEAERDRIAQRIKDALAAKKKAGGTLGHVVNLQPHNGTRAAQAAQFAAKLQPTITAYQTQGMTQREMVEAMNAAGIRTAQGGQWGLVQLQRVIQRLQ
jgi:DNA invertase Pin-like site-specific DNA recombinase